MNREKYEIKASSSFLRYEFDSIGKYGIIRKGIAFELINERENIYNLAFGDIDQVTKYINDDVISNNGDLPKVMATIIEAIFDFTNHFSDSFVFFKGLDKRRHYFYNRIIFDYYSIFSLSFNIFGMILDENEKISLKQSEIYRKDKEYDGFLIRRID